MGIGFHFDDIERSAFGLDVDEDKPIGGFHDDTVHDESNSMEDKYKCANRCPVVRQTEDELCKRISSISDECNYWRSVCFRLQSKNVEKLMSEPPKPIVLQLPKDSDVQSLMNAINKKETQIVPSHPVFWAKQWKCLSCGELIDLPEMTDVCDYKYCPYCSSKNTICGKTMEELHIEGD